MLHITGNSYAWYNCSDIFQWLPEDSYTADLPTTIGNLCSRPLGNTVDPERFPPSSWIFLSSQPTEPFLFLETKIILAYSDHLTMTIQSVNIWTSPLGPMSIKFIRYSLSTLQEIYTENIIPIFWVKNVKFGTINVIHDIKQLVCSKVWIWTQSQNPGYVGPWNIDPTTSPCFFIKAALSRVLVDHISQIIEWVSFTVMKILRTPKGFPSVYVLSVG